MDFLFFSSQLAIISSKLSNFLQSDQVHPGQLLLLIYQLLAHCYILKITGSTCVENLHE